VRVIVLAMLTAVALLGTALSRCAEAAISPLQQIDGPSPDILDLGGVAMAEDGSGGIVYRKRTEGRAHVFVAQTVNSAWTWASNSTPPGCGSRRREAAGCS
jgi:hypothetical protein